MKPDLKKALEKALNDKVTLTRNEQTKILTKAQMGIEQMVNQFAKGEPKARRDLLEYATRLGVDLTGGKEAIAAALGSDHEAIINSFFQRKLSAFLLGDEDIAAADPAIAPDELRDDNAVVVPLVPEPKPPSLPKPKTGKELVDERMREKRELREKLAREQTSRELKREDRS